MQIRADVIESLTSKSPKPFQQAFEYITGTYYWECTPPGLPKVARASSPVETEKEGRGNREVRRGKRGESREERWFGN